MHDTPAGLAPDPNFEDALEVLVGEICAPLNIGYRINHLNPAIDSANIDAQTAPRIARLIKARVAASKPRAVVVTHGTDTMAFTAARLAFDLANLGCPVVVTGSQRPRSHPQSDVRANLSLAIRAAVQANPEAPVSIAFGAQLLPAVRAVKTHTHKLDAFRAARELVPGHTGVPRELQQHNDRATAARVISVRLVPALTAEDLLAAVGGNPDGLVIETYGAGNAPMAKPGFSEALRQIADKIPVVSVTQCAEGTVDTGLYAVGSQLAECGVIDGADMTLEAAVAKLSFGLDAGLEGAPLKSLFQLNLTGERR